MLNIEVIDVEAINTVDPGGGGQINDRRGNDQHC